MADNAIDILFFVLNTGLHGFSGTIRTTVQKCKYFNTLLIIPPLHRRGGTFV